MPQPSNEIEGDGLRWSVADLIDFEFALDAASVADPARDRALFVDRIAPALGDRASDRSAVFLAWLRASGKAGTPSAGALFERGRQAAWAVVVAIGLLLGSATAAGLVSHDGLQPINAPLFLAWTVGLQVGLVAAALMAAAARAMGFRFTTLRAWLETLVRLMAGLFSHLDGERRLAVRHQLARVSARSSQLAPFVGLALMKLTQSFAIAFNLGILASMLLAFLPFLELRFGWQSTYSLGPEAVYNATQAIAAPWSWISDALTPSRAQILATEFARGQSSLSLDPSAAHAWWPFLLCAVAFYGLTLRLIAAGLMGALLRWRLLHPSFTHPAANAHAILACQGTCRQALQESGLLSSEIGDSVIVSTPLTHPNLSTYWSLAILVMRCAQVAIPLLGVGCLLSGAINIRFDSPHGQNIVSKAYQDAYANQSAAGSPHRLMPGRRWGVCRIPARLALCLALRTRRTC